jgi:uncharacterized membrane protein YjfL (UPF0719 family)
MPIKTYFDKDSYTFGALLGLILPFPSALLFATIVRGIQVVFHVLESVKAVDMLLLGLAVNIIVMRQYFRKTEHHQTAKGLLFISLLLTIAFFIFLRNKEIGFPF